MHSEKHYIKFYIEIERNLYIYIYRVDVVEGAGFKAKRMVL